MYVCREDFLYHLFSQKQTNTRLISKWFSSMILYRFGFLYPAKARQDCDSLNVPLTTPPPFVHTQAIWYSMSFTFELCEPPHIAYSNIWLTFTKHWSTPQPPPLATSPCSDPPPPASNPILVSKLVSKKVKSKATHTSNMIVYACLLHKKMNLNLMLKCDKLCCAMVVSTCIATLLTSPPLHYHFATLPYTLLFYFT